jgi:hypothetical protein
VLIGIEMFYDKLEEVDKELIKIQEWQEEEIKKLYAKTEIKIQKALAKLGPHMPEEIKHGRR